MQLELSDLDRDGALGQAAARLPAETRKDFLLAGLAGGGAALAALVLAEPGRAASKSDVEILNYALVLEYLQAAFYTEAERRGALRTRTARETARVLGAVERAHVRALRHALGSVCGRPYCAPSAYVRRRRRTRRSSRRCPRPRPNGRRTSDASTPWGLLAALSAIAALAALVVARASRPLAVTLRARRPSGGAAKPEPVQLRAAPEVVEEPWLRAPLAQYAPEQAVADDAEERAGRSVVRRTGLLRSRFVVVAEGRDGSGGAAGSRSFWRVGRERFRGRAAEHAWDDLLNDLRRSGWEPDSARRSEFYVLLRKVEPKGVTSILPTIDAYTHVQEDAGEG